MPDWRFEVVDEIGSTNDALIERAVAGETHGIALLAHRQTKGRGRRGRTWIGPSGNLALSVLLRPSLPSAAIGQVVFVAGLALREALQSFVMDGRSLSLKWPNDVLLDGAKLAGVLVESEPGPTDVAWIVIGFGANLAHAPALEDRRTASLGPTPPDAEAVALRVLSRLDEWLSVLAASGFEPVRSAWLDAAHPVGTSLSAGGLTGVFAGLSEDGALRLRSANGVVTVTNGEVLLA
jgi:BirA family biotin operon repressor/biotin-[acetyl-CoA-carboxylase] ligase